MAEANNDNSLDRLTEIERKHLHDYCEVTGAEDIGEAIDMLQSRQWDLQAAIQAFYEPSNTDHLYSTTDTAEAPGNELRRRGMQNQTGQNGRESDDSFAERQLSSGQGRESTRPTSSDLAFSWIPLLAWPVILLYRIFKSLVQSLLLILGLRHIVRGGIPGTTADGQPSGRSGTTPADDARDFRLSFEESFGNIHPPFFAGTYMRTIEAARREFKHLVVILWSAEHDDTAVFGRALTSPDVVAYLSQPQFIVWAGNVARSEAFHAALALGATSFPFIALAALKSQSRQGTAASADGGQFRLQVVARMDGLPSLGQAQTASSSDEVNQLARFICSLIGDSIERHEVELRLARSEQEGREAERRLREQQNAAYEASLARDRERESVARAKEEQERMERQREEERQRKSLRIGELQTQWRWATLARLLAEEEREAANIDGGGPTNGEVCKLNLRLENGSRIIKTFPADVELQRLFDFVETRAVAGEWEARKETPYGPDLHSVEFPEGYEHDYDFVLVSQFPRVVFGDKRAILKSALQAKSMWPSATLIVEPIFESDSDSDSDNNRTGD